jgi:hypothetical protein
VRTIAQAAKWVDVVGVGLLYPNGDYVLPSLWEAMTGHAAMDWEAPETWRVWEWKDELPARRLACVGLHVARTSSIVAPALVSSIYSVTEESRADLDGLEREIAEASRSLRRPATRAELRLLVGADKRLGDRAINALQRKLVLTNAGVDHESSHWGATLHDLFARRWRQKLRRIPPREEALARLAVAIVRSETSAADLAAALRIRRREATETLERLESEGALRRVEPLLWTPAARGSSVRSRAAGSRSSPRRSR